MTVGTNALLEGTGARTSLVATEGFGDLLELRRQTRAHLYRLDAHHPPPLVPHERAHEVRERTGPDGVLEPLDEASLARVVQAVRDDGSEAVAVGLLFSFAHPGHERRVAEALRAALPGRPRQRLVRGAPRDPGVRAPLHDGRRRLPDARAGRVPRAARGPGRRGGAPGPGDHAVQRRRAADRGLPRPRGLDGPQRAGRRRGRRGARGRARGPAAGPDVRHGRDVVRRGARARRRPGPRRGDGDRGAPAAPADARRGDGLRRRGQRGVGRLGRRAARGPALRRGASRAGGLRSRRRPADRHGRQRRPRADPRGPPPRRPPARPGCGAGRGGRARRGARPGGGGVRRGHRHRGGPGDGARPAARERRARRGPARGHAHRLRRGGPAARVPGGRRARGAPRGRPARGRRARRPRPGRGGRAAGLRADRPGPGRRRGRAGRPAGAAHRAGPRRRCPARPGAPRSTAATSARATR